MDLSNTTPLLPVLTSAAGRSAKPSKLHDAAQQFEALMVGEMMKSVRESGSEGWLGSGDDEASSSAMDMAESQFAQALSVGGGLGLSKMIEQSVGGESSRTQNVYASRDSVSIGSPK